MITVDQEIADRQRTFAAAFRSAEAAAGGNPIEAGLILHLADNECAHGRLPSDRIERTDPCGCWTSEPKTTTPDLMTTLKTTKTKAKATTKPKPKPDTLTLVISDFDREIERLTKARDELRKLAA